MKTFRACFAFIIGVGLPIVFGSGCLSGNDEPVAGFCPANAKSLGAHPFAAFTNPAGRPVGESCAYDNQCATNRCSGDAIAGICGECVTIRALGETCNGLHQGCSISAVCQDGICKSLRKIEGEECALGAKGDDREECDVELFCARTGGFDEPGTCTRRAPRGECCGDEFIHCALGTECNRDTHVCEIPIPGACMYGYYCVDGTSCGDDLMCHPGTLPENAPCGIVNEEFVNTTCSPGLMCGNVDFPNGGTTKTTCVPLPSKGEPCINGYCAEGLFCRRSMVDDRITACESPRGEGEECRNGFYYDAVPCTEGLECRAGACRTACK